MSDRREFSRRTFLKVVGVVGAGLAVGAFTEVACGAEPNKTAAKAFVPTALVRVDPDGSVVITIAQPDMGQGVRTSLAMLIADEMDADWSKVKVVQAETNPALYGRQGVGGSSSIRGSQQKLRQMGASVRAMLIAAAAKQWGVDPSVCRTEKGKVINTATGKTLDYGSLTAQASDETLPTGKIALKDAADLKIITKGATRVDNPDVATGKAAYGMDVKVPGMVYAVIARPPAFSSSLKSVDDAAARKVPGVVDVQKVSRGVAVFATNTWAALSGREALKIEWTDPADPGLNSASIQKKLAGAVIEHLPMPAGSKVVEYSVDFPYLAHATMEPMNCLADVQEDSCNLWLGTQSPDRVQAEVAGDLKLSPDKVKVNVMLVGGGFGRRLQTDYVHEAVELSKAIKKPVKLVWSREDDMKNDFYRPACHSAVKAAVDSNGNPVGWSVQILEAGGGDSDTFGNPDIPYDIPGAKRRYSGVDCGIPTGPWRSVEHTFTVPTSECLIDEMAHAAGKDAVEFRKAILKDDRLKNVLEVAADKGDWGKPMPAGHGRGIACFEGYGSYAAHVVELSVEGNKINVHRIVAVIDCGLAVNPKGVEAQMQGAATDALSTCLRAAITIDKGGVVQNTWTDYRWMTLDAMPKLEVHIVTGTGNIGGMGEPGYPSAPAAIANAVFSATGKRVRRFPIKVEELA